MQRVWKLYKQIPFHSPLEKSFFVNVANAYQSTRHIGYHRYGVQHIWIPIFNPQIDTSSPPVNAEGYERNYGQNEQAIF